MCIGSTTVVLLMLLVHLLLYVIRFSCELVFVAFFWCRATSAPCLTSVLRSHFLYVFVFVGHVFWWVFPSRSRLLLWPRLFVFWRVAVVVEPLASLAADIALYAQLYCRLSLSIAIDR